MEEDDLIEFPGSNMTLDSMENIKFSWSNMELELVEVTDINENLCLLAYQPILVCIQLKWKYSAVMFGDNIFM